ncbi:putative transcriptional regulator YheO [Dongia mobilis]|uniref:Putative transcriptional regulator YheO n=1 Tax=Dongia mobilis TaxID=578943 RepID=A0A4R6WIG6_9PROT|nr:PAS domain-containing protein [Dongia mobilis]TDQ77678.1 putative transcriptional regulator YheO [Dongia mobilis]
MTRKLPKPPGALALHFPTAAAIAALLAPWAEVVIHDLKRDRIAGIWNAFSRRRPGDPSLLGDDPELIGDSDIYGPYEKAGSDGGRLKSVSAALRDESGRRVGLLCINFDVVIFDQAVDLLRAFAVADRPRPEPIFAQDWREQINLGIRAFLQERGLALKALDRADRVAMIATLDRQGLFATRNAVQHVADALGLSRATIYNLLNDARERQERRL